MRSRAQRGLTLVELMIVVVIAALLASIAIPMLQDSLRKSARAALVSEARDLHAALKAYHAANGTFPVPLHLNQYTPLSTQGYFTKGESLNGKLLGQRPMFYVAPSGGSQFFSMMRLKSDPSVIVFVAHASLPGISPDFWDGVFLVEDGRFVPVDQGS